ncbi:hypothetical protein [Cohnella hongkongensis]|uniref:Uncharacterized protein n=1 Tax=Cohnella hongkongensis TaxID=178337 RepID=A0ABV9FHJ5_9BACL
MTVDEGQREVILLPRETLLEEFRDEAEIEREIRFKSLEKGAAANLKRIFLLT